MTTDKLICAVQSGKYEGATFVVGEEYHMEYGTMTHLLRSLDMDPIKHALDDFGCAIINRDNLPLTLHKLAQASTKNSDALDIETIGNLVDSVL